VGLKKAKSLPLCACLDYVHRLLRIEQIGIDVNTYNLYKGKAAWNIMFIASDLMESQPNDYYYIFSVAVAVVPTGVSWHSDLFGCDLANQSASVTEDI